MYPQSGSHTIRDPDQIKTKLPWRQPRTKFLNPPIKNELHQDPHPNLFIPRLWTKNKIRALLQKHFIELDPKANSELDPELVLVLHPGLVPYLLAPVLPMIKIRTLNPILSTKLENLEVKLNCHLENDPKVYLGLEVVLILHPELLLELGMISHKRSQITISGHKHEIENFSWKKCWFIVAIKLRILNQYYIKLKNFEQNGNWDQKMLLLKFFKVYIILFLL